MKTAHWRFLIGGAVVAADLKNCYNSARSGLLRRNMMTTAFRFLIACGVAALVVSQTACGGGSSSSRSGGGVGIDGIANAAVADAQARALSGTAIVPDLVAFNALVRSERHLQIRQDDALTFPGSEAGSEDRVHSAIRSERGDGFAVVRRQDPVISPTDATVTLAAATAHAWRFALDDSTSMVTMAAEDIANEFTAEKFRFGSATVSWNAGDGTLTNYIADAHFFEAEYAGFGMWIESPDTFFSDADNVAVNISDSGAGVFYYGLTTPQSELPSGSATYEGGAVGYFLIDIDGTTGIPRQRRLVGGDVFLDADFNANTIAGNVEITLYNPATFGGIGGAATLTLSNGAITPATGIFSGDVDVFDAHHAIPFNQLVPGEVTTDSGFSGVFAGPAASEASGAVLLETTGAPAANGVDRLEFGFLIKKQ